MRSKLEKSVDTIVVFLLKHLNTYHYYIKSKYNNTTTKYQFLTPNDEAEHIEEYSIALENALNEKKVRNIAVSGSYGSGKSSFIKTFEKNHENGIYKFLDISLARFNKKNESSTIDPSLIEKSILEQMFYKVKSKKIPQSRLNKINRLRFLPIKIISILSVVLSFFIVFKPELLSKVIFFKDILALFQFDYIKYIPALILLIGAYFFVQKFLFILSNTRIDKLNLKDLELVSNDKANESLLNRHLDEILYFFEKTSFNVIVFQDLDRFENLDIFTKLRELNNFINNSEQINRNIKFIYAVKDEMFCDSHERTKFFDFVIPIIPYINATNSKDKLLEFFQDEVKPSFLYDISLYISDMRLLKNIYNEYKIYSISLDPQLNKTDLLAMIIYKNFEPQDFEKLHKYKGLVYDVFDKKSEYIKTVIDKLNSEIEEIEEKIQEIDKEPQVAIHELRKIYLLKIVEKFSSRFNGNIYISNTAFNLANALEDKNFELIKKSEEITYDSANGKLDFKNIDKEVNPKYSYQQREQFILDKTNNKKNELLKQINKLKDEINEIEDSSVQKIINTYKDIKIFDENFEKKPLLKYLISYGHINKDYDIYMSNFFGISISKNDNDFLLNIKNNGTHFDFNYNLKNLEEILKKERLEIGEYKKEAILNFKLFDYIIDNQKKYIRQYIQILKQLSNESEVSIEFIFEYLNTQKNKKAFIQGLVRHYPSVWQYIAMNKTDEEKSKYFYMFLNNLEYKDIVDLNVNDSLKTYIGSFEKFESPNEFFNNRLTRLIKDLNINFKFFQEVIDKTTPYKFIYENNFYELNQQMIDYIMYVESDYDSTVHDSLIKAHYTVIKNSKAEKLKQYIANNINEYIKNVNLAIDTNTRESEETIIELLNSKDIEADLKVKIIQKENTLLSDISAIDNKSLWDIVVRNNHMESNWKNILYYYQYVDEIDDDLISYLSIKSNAIELTKKSFLISSFIKDNEMFDKDKIHELLENILTCQEMDIETFEHFAKSIIYSHYNLDISELDEEKIALLVKHNKFAFSRENFDKLQKFTKTQHIVFLEKYLDKFIENYDNFSIDSNDIAKLLESKNISDKHKKEIIELIDYDLISTPKIAKLIYSNVDKTVIRSYSYIKNMISQLESTESKVNLLVEQESELHNEELIEILKLMPDKYSQIAKLDGTQTVISDKDYNKKFVKLLHSRKFITSDKPEKKDQIRLFIKSKK